MLLSAKSSTALETSTHNLVAYLQQQPTLNLADLAYTLQVGRSFFSQRRLVVCRDRNDALQALTGLEPNRVLTGVQEARDQPVVFLFPGQGSQYVGMGAELYAVEPTFRETVDQCAEQLKPALGLDLRQVLYPEACQQAAAQMQLNQTAITQPALFVIEYALARLWQSWGVQPQAMLGHSIGEYVAACLAGVFSLEAGLRRWQFEVG